jgi:micrococcal nuclease
MLQPGWVYRAKVNHLIDGDTIGVVVDLGFHVHVVEVVRLDGVNAPELHAPDPAPGRAALAFVVDWLAGAGTGEWPLVIVTRKGTTQEKYGRYLARVLRSSDGAELCADLLLAGFAVAYSGGAR